MVEHVLTIRGRANILIDGGVVVRGVDMHFHIPFDIDEALEEGAIDIEDKVARFHANIFGVKLALPAQVLLKVLQADLVDEIEDYVKEQSG